MATPKNKTPITKQATPNSGVLTVITEDPSIKILGGAEDKIRTAVKVINNVKVYTYNFKISQQLKELFEKMELTIGAQKTSSKPANFIYEIFRVEILDRISNSFKKIFPEYFIANPMTNKQLFSYLSVGLKISTKDASAKKLIDEEILSFNSENINNKIANKIYEEFYKDPSIAVEINSPDYQYIKNKPKLVGFYNSSNDEFTNTFKYDEQFLVSLYEKIYQPTLLFNIAKATLNGFIGFPNKTEINYVLYSDDGKAPKKFTIEDAKKSPTYKSELLKLMNSNKPFDLILKNFFTTGEITERNLLDFVNIVNLYYDEYYGVVAKASDKVNKEFQTWLEFYGQKFDNEYTTFLQSVNKFQSVFSEDELNSIKFGGNTSINRNPALNKNLTFKFDYKSIKPSISKSEFYLFIKTARDFIKLAPSVNLPGIWSIEGGYLKFFALEGPVDYPTKGKIEFIGAAGPGADYSKPGESFADAKGIKIFIQRSYDVIFDKLLKAFDSNYKELLDYYQKIYNIKVEEVDPYLDIFFNGPQAEFPIYTSSEGLVNPKYYGLYPDLDIDLLYDKQVDIYKNRDPKLLFTFAKPQLLSHDPILTSIFNKEGKSNYKPSSEQKLINSLQPSKIFVYKADYEITNLVPDLINNGNLFKELNVLDDELSFYDLIEPNKNYYYFYVAKFTAPTDETIYNIDENFVIISGENLYWVGSPIIKVNLVRDSNFYYLETDTLSEKSFLVNKYEESFKNKISITPKAKPFNYGGSSFATGQSNFIKIRTTSLKTRKKVDLNLKYTIGKDKKEMNSDEYEKLKPVSVETLDDPIIKKLVKDKFINEDVTETFKTIVNSQDLVKGIESASDLKIIFNPGLNSILGQLFNSPELQENKQINLGKIISNIGNLLPKKN